MRLHELFHRGRTQAGNALVEFALVLPVLLIITVGVIDVGRYAYFSILVTNAARAGAQYGSQSGSTAIDPGGIAAAATADLGPNPIGVITTSPIVHEFGCYDTTNASMAAPFPATTDTTTQGCSVSTQTPVPYVSVTVTGTLTPLFQVPWLLPSSITVTQTSVMRVQCLTGGC